ncbi:MAG: cysteine desulfurase family protein [Nanoarchaeota archaeon]|nr:cysteine desulfurase family protein [Nanoarchaeota archaeon]
MKTIYFDNASTTAVDDKVVKAMIPYFSEKYGNASSVHHIGFEAKEALEKSREIIAKSINAEPEEIYFTSGGTEANNFALKGIIFANPNKKHIITTKIEHACVLNTCKWLEEQGIEVSYIEVDRNGFVNPRNIELLIRDNTALVSVIHGHNEIGTIQNIEEIGKICRKKGVYFHTDACQSYTKTDINVKKQNLDLVTLNSHKIHGPKGVGVLYIKKGVNISPLIHGGGHEKGLRSGTENISGIIGFAEAVKISDKKDIEKMEKLRDYIIKEILKIPNTKLNGSLENRLCNNINISFSNIEGESIAGYLNNYGICVSTGSACSSHTLEPSYVLMAIGSSHLGANSSIRITISRYTTKKEIDFLLDKLNKVVKQLREISPFK